MARCHKDENGRTVVIMKRGLFFFSFLFSSKSNEMRLGGGVKEIENEIKGSEKKN